MTPRWLPALTVVLALGLVASLVGWFFSGREGAGTPIDCYAIEGSDSRVVVGFWDQQSSTTTHDTASAVDVSYVLNSRLGNRPVVDPAGQPIRKC
jgi:hypothetical protein